MSEYIYTTNEYRSIRIDDLGPHLGADVSTSQVIDGEQRWTGLRVPHEQRLHAAGALAGRGYCVVSTDVRRHLDRLEACLRDRDCGGQPLGGIVADLRRAVDGGQHDE